MMRKVLRRPDFRLLFTALLCSMTGESIMLLVLAIWVKDLTGSTSLAGGILFAVTLPVLLAPLIGWVVDRFPRRPFLICVNLGTIVVISPLFAVRDRGDSWIIFLVAVCYGVSFLAVSSALNGLIKEVVPADLLSDANGALQTVKQGLRLGGPLAGAALFTAVGGWAVAATAAAGFALAAGLLSVLRVTERPVVPPSLTWLGEIGAGVRHLMREPALRRMLLAVAAAMLIFGFTESLLFALVDEGLHKGAGFVGVLVSVQGVGGLLGGLAASTAVRRLGEMAAAGTGLLIFVPALVVFAIPDPTVPLVLAPMALAGFGLPLAIVAFNTLLQRRTPAELLGRASAATEALVSGPQAASIGVGAVLVAAVDYRILYLCVAVALTLAGAVLWAGRRLSPPVTEDPADPAAESSTVPSDSSQS